MTRASAGEPVAPLTRTLRPCGRCGKSILAEPDQRAGGECRCENCFLDARRPEVDRSIDAERHAFTEALAAALDLREQETGLHSKRVACHTLVLAKRFTRDREALRQIYWGALLHDIGKIGVPDAILLKPGPLTRAEEQVMRTHPEKGHAILTGVPVLQDAAQIVLSHEERFDGSGYPRGLAGGAIPFGARLFSVIDTLDAMTSDRPYRRALEFDAAKAEILRFAGTQFDPAAAEAFVAEERKLREMVAVKCPAAWDGAPFTNGRGGHGNPATPRRS
ncbi:MAG: HD domain-containing protein [Betaproteobacteria bacterium]|nr:MAG: HD domain-containing protein [Betaproteobacteria bacterium]